MIAATVSALLRAGALAATITTTKEFNAFVNGPRAKSTPFVLTGRVSSVSHERAQSLTLEDEHGASFIFLGNFDKVEVDDLAVVSGSVMVNSPNREPWLKQVEASVIGRTDAPPTPALQPARLDPAAANF